MFHIVCLTKSWNKNDFQIWYQWHKQIADKIHIIDNESTIDIESMIEEGDTYEKLTGWPNQWKLFGDICMDNRYGFSPGDDVGFIDDDEYLWFDSGRFQTFGESLQKQYQQLDCILLPQILISTKKLSGARNKPLIEHSTYRRNDYTSQGKSIFKWKPDTKYKFRKSNSKEEGHVPWINGIRASEVQGPNGYGCSPTTYGLTYPEADIRLYHYHIKSSVDWVIKHKRGSAAVDHQWYDQDIRKNPHFDGYNVPDLSMLNHPIYRKIKEKLG